MKYNIVNAKKYDSEEFDCWNSIADAEKIELEKELNFLFYREEMENE